MKIWRLILRSPLGKGIAVLLALTLTTQMLTPTIALALTGGPSQPEFEGFTEIGVNNMVDPFTGDFSYEIPLMTVPGPNGGYPINLTYNAGAGMEDEASWVGLGWSLNPGAINRNMRGVPDDFSGPQEENGQTLVSTGDRITKSYFTKDNVTVGVGAGLNLTLPEIGGADLSFIGVSPNLNFYYNSYKGVGIRTGVGLKLSAVGNEAGSGGLAAGLNLNFDSNEGASAQPSLSFSAKGEQSQASISIGFGYTSRQGISNTFLNTSLSKTDEYEGKSTRKKNPRDKNSETETYVKDFSKTTSSGSGVSFASSSGVPSNSMAMGGFNTGFNLDFEAGALQTEFDIPMSFNGMLSVQKVKDWMRYGYAYPAYGTLYSGYRENDDIPHGRALMDYNREKDFAINLKTPMLPMPVMTQDIYSVQGAGIGGTFKAFRNDVGVFYEPRTTSDFLGLTIGMEVGVSTGFKIGVDPSVNFSHSYSGKWKVDDDVKQLTTTNFFRKSSDLVSANGLVQTLEPFDFRFVGEVTAHSSGDSRFATIGGAGFGNYALFPATDDFPSLSDMEYEDPDASSSMNNFFPFENLGKFKPKVSNKMNGMPILSTHTVRKAKERKVNLVSYRTKTEIVDELTNNNSVYLANIFVTNPQAPISQTIRTDYTMSDPEIQGHHLGEFTITNTGGMRYVYGLPLMNRVHEEYYFALKSNPPYATKNVQIGSLDDILDKQKGEHYDKMFNSTKISPYAHTHLLTHIVSPDYVDLTSNGPSEDDFGYWTKFNYRTIENYKWRTPIGKNTVNFVEGLPSNPNDNKGTFTYGERDMTYLHSIETKTHIAVFYLDNVRDDARDVNDRNGTQGAPGKMKCLTRIELYAKADLNQPIKSVHFTYDYSLCKGANNSSEGNGKLTLKSLYFTYGNSSKGQLAPYKFEYGTVYEVEEDEINMEESATLSGNQDYSTMDVDRWGNYKMPQTIGGITYSNQDIPYVDQSASGEGKRIESATAWNLTKISLPTGAHIKIAYESDDYASVQDKTATQMYQIVGMGDDNGSIDMIADQGQNAGASIERNMNRVYFKLDDPGTTNSVDVKNMLMQISDSKVYFKTWQRLQKPKGRTYWAYDYVTGYAEIQAPVTDVNCGVSNGYGYFTLKDDNSNPGKNWNSFRKAGLQYMRYQRADLDMAQTQGESGLQAAAMILGIVPMIFQAMELISGYYNYAIMRNYAKEIGPGRPSFVKLGSGDGIKYGGGHRVKQITINDAWDEMANASEATYGLRYDYSLESYGNIISSGVASYEPLIGGEENPMKKAHYYGPDNKNIHNDPAFFLEEPFGESYFPAPVVGYSKVSIINLANLKTKKTGDGVQVKEFYTAKDFPIKAMHTVQPQRVEDKQTVFLPLIATISLKGYGYSQGYYIELNDMHGKPKAESLYDRDDWDITQGKLLANSIPLSKKIYKYKSSGNNLINTVDVLDADQQVRTAIMGESSEMFSEMKEDFSYFISAGGQINGGVDPLPVGVFITAFPNFEYNENSARTVVTTKVVNKIGILDEVVEMAEGAVKTTKNLLYDPENGSPLLTAVTSDYDNAQQSQNNQYIYNYTYPAHWYYSGMQAAYRNYRNYYTFSGTNAFPNPEKYFEKGDELLSEAGQRVWVTAVNQGAQGSVIMVDASGNVVTPNGRYVTLRSGKRNMQNVPSGSLASLVNPIGAYHNPLIDFYNENVYQNSAYSGAMANTQFPDLEFEGIPDCANPDLFFTGSIQFEGNNSFYGPQIIFEYNNPALISDPENQSSSCQTAVTIPQQLMNLDFSPANLEFGYYKTGWLLLNYHTNNGSLIQIPVKLHYKCTNLTFCMDGVLNASADEFSDEWVYASEFGPFAALNDYLKGNRGIWRKLRTNAYFTDRKQYNESGDYNTFIGRDGTYERFSVFDWLFSNEIGALVGNKNNIQAPQGWRWQAEVTPYGYSPYGFEIENRNALNIYSSELYGYGNSVVTASANNAAYHEIAFDGFEESASTTYQPRGHLALQAAANTNASISISTEESHTGNRSLKINTGSGFITLTVPVVGQPDIVSYLSQYGLQFLRNRKYVLSFWFKFSGNNAQSITVNFKKQGVNNGPFPGTVIVSTDEPAIEGWRRAEIMLDTKRIWDLYDLPFGGFTSTNAAIDIVPSSGSVVYLDDIRIHPADAAFKSYVYDPQKYLLRAILDDNNYAAFFNYDEENTLIQVKKETSEGIRTIQTTRKNVKHTFDGN